MARLTVGERGRNMGRMMGDKDVRPVVSPEMRAEHIEMKPEQ